MKELKQLEEEKCPLCKCYARWVDEELCECGYEKARIEEEKNE